MRKSFKADILIAVKVVPAREAWIESREEPVPDSVLALQEALMQKPQPFTQEAPYLCWGKGQEPKKVDFNEAITRLVGIVEKEDVDLLLNFFKEIGLLFTKDSIPLSEAFSRIALLCSFVGLRYSNKTDEIREDLISPLKNAMKKWPETKRWTWQYLGEDIRALWVPAKRGSWPIFYVPEAWPKEREDLLNYAKEEIRRNVLLHLRRKRLTPGWSKSGKLIMYPPCLYDALLLYHCFEEPESMEGPELLTQSKRDALAYFRSYKARDKISQKEYDKIKQAIDRAWTEGVRGLAELREVGHEAIDWKLIKESAV